MSSSSHNSQTKELTFTEKVKLYTTGTFLLPTHSLTHHGPPLDWNDAAKLAQHMGIRQTVVGELPNTAGFSEPQLYDTYAKYVMEHGSKQAQDALAAGNQVIIGLRVTTNSRTNRGQGVFDDRIAVIWSETTKPAMPNGRTPQLLPTSLGAPSMVVKRGADFVANTEPSAQYEEATEFRDVKGPDGKVRRCKVATKILDPQGRDIVPRIDPKTHQQKIDGQDVRHEGRRALGELVPGTYQFHFGNHKFAGAEFLDSRADQRVNRDVNHDGTFTASDVWQNDKGETVIETGNFNIYIHRGGFAGPGGVGNTGSAGCQTIPRDDYDRFFRQLKRTQKSFYYVLVTVR